MKTIHIIKMQYLALSIKIRGLLAPFLTGLCVFLGCWDRASAQEEKSSINESWTFSGYCDTYYAVYSDTLSAHYFQQFATSSSRNKNFGLNIFQLGVHYQKERVRGNVVLHYGDIPDGTWDADLPMVEEANAGVQVASSWWVDAGLFTTHIGTESFLPKNNFTTSTAIATYNEPFYQGGIRLSYEGNEKLQFQFWVINGYNLFKDNNSAKSFGLLFAYQFNDNMDLTYTNLMGRESSDEGVNQFRTYHNLYLQYEPIHNLTLLVGGDMGTQTNADMKDQSHLAIMYNALFTVNYHPWSKVGFTGRYEIFRDNEGFISGVFLNKEGIPIGLKAMGFTISTEYRPTENSFIRLEGKLINTEAGLQIFSTKDGPSEQRWEGILSMGVSF